MFGYCTYWIMNLYQYVFVQIYYNKMLLCNIIVLKAYLFLNENMYCILRILTCY